MAKLNSQAKYKKNGARHSSINAVAYSVLNCCLPKGTPPVVSRGISAIARNEPSAARKIPRGVI